MTLHADSNAGDPPPRGAAGDAGAELVEVAALLAERVKAAGVLLIADPPPDAAALARLRGVGRVVIATQHPPPAPADAAAAPPVIELPDVRLGRSDQIKLAVLTGITTGVLPSEGRLVALVGRYGAGAIDTAMVVDLGRESELLLAGATAEVARVVRPAVFHTVLRLAIEIANEGREGKKVGTMFVVGDHEKVLALSRSLIFNPFHGYPEEQRNVQNPAVWETMKEFAALDGAFLIREDGVVIAAGRYLNAGLPDGETVALGLGSRHAAAAGITALATDAVAVVVSQSNGTVRVYKGGRVVLEIERPA
jgi:DNA integrity scanning protein DisA with diadenylate cyclase activity